MAVRFVVWPQGRVSEIEMIRKIQEDWYDENRGAGEEKHVGSNNYYTGKPKQVSQTPGEQPEKNQPEPVGSNK